MHIIIQIVLYLFCLIKPFGLLAPKTFKIMWRYNLSSLSTTDEDYSRMALCALHLISTFLLQTIPDTFYLTF